MLIKTNNKLLRRNRPKSDESFHGYIIRLTEENGYESPSWILKMAGINSSVSYCSWSVLLKRNLDLSLLGNLVDISTFELDLLLCPPIDPYFDNLIFGLKAPRNMLQISPSKICPRCLEESNYLRKIWDIIAVTTCPTHKCLLVEKCSNCFRSIDLNRNRVSICQCGFDLHNNPTFMVEEAELSLSCQIHRVCGVLYSNDIGNYSKNNPLFSYSLNSLLSALLLMAAAYKDIYPPNPKHLVSRQENLQYHQLFSKVFNIYENWPINYYQFLDCRQLDITDSSGETLLFKKLRWFNDIIDPLDNEWNFIKNAFDDYVSVKLRNDSTPYQLKRQISSLLNKQFVTKKTAELLLQRDSLNIENLVEQGVLKALVYKIEKDPHFLIEKCGIERLIHNSSQFMAA